VKRTKMGLTAPVGLTITLLALISQISSGQTTVTGSVKTGGVCSPAIFQPKGKITIECDASGISPEQAAEQAKQLAELLTLARQSSEKMDKLIEMMKNVQVYAIPRHLTKDQTDAITALVRPFPNAKVLIMTGGGEDSPAYANEFAQAFKSAGIVPEEETQVVPSKDAGVWLIANPIDHQSKTVPEWCARLSYLLNSDQITDHVTADAAAKQGTCLLFVGYRQPHVPFQGPSQPPAN
jgi:hypothetical protein